MRCIYSTGAADAIGMLFFTAYIIKYRYHEYSWLMRMQGCAQHSLVLMGA
jgi:hypothetical protein